MTEEEIRKVCQCTTFLYIGKDGDCVDVTRNHNTDLIEAYMSCVLLAEDDAGLRLALRNDISEASVIVRSLVKNLPKYGYKLIKDSD